MENIATDLAIDVINIEDIIIALENDHEVDEDYTVIKCSCDC